MIFQGSTFAFLPQDFNCVMSCLMWYEKPWIIFDLVKWLSVQIGNRVLYDQLDCIALILKEKCSRVTFTRLWFFLSKLKVDLDIFITNRTITMHQVYKLSFRCMELPSTCLFLEVIFKADNKNEIYIEYMLTSAELGRSQLCSTPFKGA